MQRTEQATKCRKGSDFRAPDSGSMLASPDFRSRTEYVYALQQDLQKVNTRAW